MKSTIKKAQRAFESLKSYDLLKPNPDDPIILGNFLRTFLEDNPIVLIQFTCSTIDAQWLYSDTPEKYVSLNPQGNNLEADLPRYAQIIRSLTQAKIPVKSLILIGNTDPYYIYSEQGTIYPKIPKQALLQKWNQRWEAYRKNLTLWLKQKYPKIDFEVISWYDLEKKIEEKFNWSFEQLFNRTLAEEKKYFDPKDYAWELRKLKTQFGEDKYFATLEKPADTVLKRWVKRKFTEYAIQGLWIKQTLPTGILIQNEKPTLLRYKMYQPLIRKTYGTSLPNLYFYGIDNTGYQ